MGSEPEKQSKTSFEIAYAVEHQIPVIGDWETNWVPVEVAQQLELDNTMLHNQLNRELDKTLNLEGRLEQARQVALQLRRCKELLGGRRAVETDFSYLMRIEPLVDKLLGVLGKKGKAELQCNLCGLIVEDLNQQKQLHLEKHHLLINVSEVDRYFIKTEEAQPKTETQK